MTDWKKEFRLLFEANIFSWDMAELEPYIDQLLKDQREELIEEIKGNLDAHLIYIDGVIAERANVDVVEWVKIRPMVIDFVNKRLDHFKPARPQTASVRGHLDREECYCELGSPNKEVCPKHASPQEPECNRDTIYCQEHNQIKGKFTFPQESEEKKQAPHWMDCNCECHGFGATDEAESCPHCQPERYPDYDTTPQGAVQGEDQ